MLPPPSLICESVSACLAVCCEYPSHNTCLYSFVCLRASVSVTPFVVQFVSPCLYVCLGLSLCLSVFGLSKVYLRSCKYGEKINHCVSIMQAKSAFISVCLCLCLSVCLSSVPSFAVSRKINHSNACAIHLLLLRFG